MDSDYVSRWLRQKQEVGKGLPDHAARFSDVRRYFCGTFNFQILCSAPRKQPDIDDADGRAVTECKLEEIEPK